MKKNMKKVLMLFVMLFTFTLTSCGYSESDVARAKREGFEEGYDLAQYEASGEIERIKREEVDYAYEAGYEAGYDAGYWDGLDETGLNPYHGSAKIEKDN